MVLNIIFCFLFQHNDVFDNDGTSSPVFNKVTGKQSVRRTVSDSIGARLRKVSFEIGNGRRHSDEFTTEQLPQVSVGSKAVSLMLVSYRCRKSLVVH